MFGINKKTEEMIDNTKKDIKQEISSLVEDGRVWSIGLLSVACLTIGYILGAVTTSSMNKTMMIVNRKYFS